jgi:hypothetical protein
MKRTALALVLFTAAAAGAPGSAWGSSSPARIINERASAAEKDPRAKLGVPAAAAALSRAYDARMSAQTAFDAHFADKTLRLDLYQAGDAKEEIVTLHRIVQEPLWPEPTARLLDPFLYGHYALKIYEISTNELVFSRGFDTMLGEYRTTSPALAGVKRIFQRSMRIPLPKRPVLAVIETRDKQNILHPIFTEKIDPADIHIIRESPAAGDWIYEAKRTGDPRDKVDFVFLAEGYTAGDKDKFKADVDRFTAYLFSVEPYKTLQDRFNVRGIFRPSPEPAMDEPRQGVFKHTVLDASFNAFDLDRYMLIEADHRMHEIAAQVPYDAIIVLVNSKRYGGGSIAMDYCCTTVDNARSLEVFVHELGHSFAGLADEYYASEVSYNDFYPKGVEPREPNITALLDPADVKWKDLLSPGIGVPTEYGKDAIEALQAERQKNRKAQAEEIDAAKAKGGAEAAVAKIQEKYRTADKEIEAKIAAIRKQYAGLNDKVGVFEGAGYSAKGLYRPQVYCIMISSPTGEFCVVCRRGIAAMIDFFSK